MNDMTVSVIIPTYNGSEVISRAVESVISQTYENIEIIVVDDNGICSEQQIKTENNLKPYIEQKRIKYIAHEKNKNGSAARNTGFLNSSGDLICLLDDDDEYYPKKIEVQVNEFKSLSKDYAIVIVATDIYKDGVFSYTRKQNLDGYVFKEVLLHEAVIGSDALMVRRECYKELQGFDEEFKRHQDYEFTARVASKWKIKSLDYVGVKYNTLHRNDPANFDIALEYRVFFLKKMIKYMEVLKNSEKLLVIGVNMCQIIGRRRIFTHPVYYYKIFRRYLRNVNLDLPFVNYIIALCYLVLHKSAR